MPKKTMHVNIFSFMYVSAIIAAVKTYTSKKIALLITLSFISIGTKAQKKYFEGIISYSIDVKPQNSKADPIAYKRAFGNEILVYIKNGHNKQVYKNSTVLEWAMYDPKTNRIYNKLPKKDTLYYYDCAEEKRKIEVLKTKVQQMYLDISVVH
jgi:hypothetical protein